jgi:hypothetical protein
MPVTINGTEGVTLNNGSADGAQVTLASSGYSSWNLDNYSGRWRAYYGSTEYFSVTSDGLLQFNSGYGSVATAYGCRAWVNFNGTGTVAIRASGNVSSITDNGTGNYTVNFTNAMPDANYCTDGTARSSGISNGMTLGTITVLTSSVQVSTTSGSANASLDTSEVCIAIFR